MSTATSDQLEANSSRNGALSALSAYLLWGFAPIYFKLLNEIEPGEILMHRVIWSALFLLVMIVVMKKWSQLVTVFRQPKILLLLSLSASFLAVNWFLFIWAINNNHLLDASLGYYINPLFNVVLGMIFFHERLRRNQLIAVGLALTGVLVQLVALGTLPMISLALATTFAIYGLIRKKLPVNSFIGLFIESLLMLPIALIYWFFFVESSTSNMALNSSSLNFTLIMAGLVTTAPLLLFTIAAKRLTLSSLGFFQYLGPSIMFLLATFYYQETMKSAELITFIFIWAALALYTLDSLRKRA
ncbi:chloramphenical resistance permease RarD [Colwellia sp. MT41]|uniref:Chloramphenicol resistance permease RarD n=1 Tax=Colwellia marinimaniae TaxID=1513592 RepID=A0ABQ0MRF7_9GAMM|nr:MULTISPECIES: EamA family transporter RarD [Colwellia]ALO33332.1 chloramphenical resistance permease RarD [Colwellia sp. MT41]GAW94947.1 chloramphenicol resistance permease RarD [Colwellia marinimaniae]